VGSSFRTRAPRHRRLGEGVGGTTSQTPPRGNTPAFHARLAGRPSMKFHNSSVLNRCSLPFSSRLPVVSRPPRPRCETRTGGPLHFHGHRPRPPRWNLSFKVAAGTRRRCAPSTTPTASEQAPKREERAADVGRPAMAKSLDICPEIVGLQNPRQTPHSAITQKWSLIRFPFQCG
jgi:hypothetical protein